MQAFIYERRSFTTADTIQCLGVADGRSIVLASLFCCSELNRALPVQENVYRYSMESARVGGVHIHLRAQLFMAASEASRILVLAIAKVSGVQGSPRTTRTTSPSASEAHMGASAASDPWRTPVIHTSAGEAEHANEVRSRRRRREIECSRSTSY